MQIIDEICNNALLVLDDFDKLTATDNVKEVLFGIINRLYEKEKRVIFTANVNRTEIGKLYGGGIASRFAQMCDCAELKGGDMRLNL